MATIKVVREEVASRFRNLYEVKLPDGNTLVRNLDWDIIGVYDTKIYGVLPNSTFQYAVGFYLTDIELLSFNGSVKCEPCEE